MAWLIYVGICLVVALIIDWPGKRSTQQPPTSRGRSPHGAMLADNDNQPRRTKGWSKSDRFVHRGNYHNVYWTHGGRNRLQPWTNNIR